MINDVFAERFLATVNRIDDNPVHLLFNQWWNEASDDVRQSYVDMFIADDVSRAWYEEGMYADPLELDTLAEHQPGTLGREYWHWIIDNSLEAKIATNYRRFHETLEASGQLDGMPDPMRFAVLRGFQVHDFLHVLTGYDASGQGEIALQAFSLAQLPFPYFAMWISVVTTQMTFNTPTSITPLMDAISDGWQYGRNSTNLHVQPWERLLDQPLDELRIRFDIHPSPLAIRQQHGPRRD